MAFILKDRVRETTTTTGTGTVTLGGASTGYQSFSVIGNGNTTYYTIFNPGTNEWEVGIGTYTASGTTLSRTTILSSSNSGSAVNFSAGTKDVFVVYPAGKAIYLDASDNVGIGTSSPIYKLQVLGAGTITAFAGTTDTSGVAVGRFRASYTGGGGGVTSAVDLRAGDGYSYLLAESNVPMLFGTNSTERMRIDSSGNVMIGTSTPRLALTVAQNNASGMGSEISNLNTGSGTTKYAQLQYSGYDTAGTYKPSGQIIVTPADNNYVASYMSFVTRASDALSERMRIDSSGNVGIGTNSPVSKLDIISGTARMYFSNQSATAFFTAVNTANSAYAPMAINGSELILKTGDAERMRIDSSGNVLVGTTSTLFANSHDFVNSGAAVLGLRNSTATAGLYWQVGPDASNSFKVYNASSTGMFMANGATSWSSSSDETLKTDLKPIEKGLDKVNTLRSVTGRFKTDDETVSRSFLIAQDIQAVLPEAVSETPDGHLGVAYTDVIPLLVASIKELKAIIEQLKADMAALKGKV